MATDQSSLILLPALMFLVIVLHGCGDAKDSSGGTGGPSGGRGGAAVETGARKPRKGKDRCYGKMQQSGRRIKKALGNSSDGATFGEGQDFVCVTIFKALCSDAKTCSERQGSETRDKPHVQEEWNRLKHEVRERLGKTEEKESVLKSADAIFPEIDRMAKEECIFHLHVGCQKNEKSQRQLDEHNRRHSSKASQAHSRPGKVSAHPVKTTNDTQKQRDWQAAPVAIANGDMPAVAARNPSLNESSFLHESSFVQEEKCYKSRVHWGQVKLPIGGQVKIQEK